jgi:hypothetical protein
MRTTTNSAAAQINPEVDKGTLASTPANDNLTGIPKPNGFDHSAPKLVVGGANGGGKLDPFDPASLRLDQSFADQVGVKKLLTTVPVRKPGRQEFVRVHPDPQYRLVPAAIIEMKDDREVYLVAPHMAENLPDEISMAALYLTINRQGVLTLWPIKLPAADGKHNTWPQSAMCGAELAMGSWVRISANMSLGAYEIREATGDLPEPKWPEHSFNEILRIAFGDRFVDRPDHPLLQSLRGEL